MTARRSPLKPLDEALIELLSFALALDDIEPVATFEADGRVLAQDLVSALQVPSQDNSAMDGYAVRCADVAQAQSVLLVSQRIAAGTSGELLAPMTAARIFTGAPIPAGADAVVMQEDCEVLSDDAAPNGMVRLKAMPVPGQ